MYIRIRKHGFDADTLACRPSRHNCRRLVPFSGEGAALSGSTVLYVIGYGSRSRPAYVCTSFFIVFFLRGGADAKFHPQNLVEWEKSHIITARRLDRTITQTST